MTLLILLLSLVNASEIERIKAITFDKTKVEPITVAPGLAAQVAFPCPIEETFVGLENDLKATTSTKNPNILILSFTSNEALPTNLMVRCVDSADPFIFDVLPSARNNQDYLKIISAQGAPEHKSSGLTLVGSSAQPAPSKEQKKQRIIELEKPTLVETQNPLDKLRNRPTEQQNPSRPSGVDELKKELQK